MTLLRVRAAKDQMLLLQHWAQPAHKGSQYGPAVTIFRSDYKLSGLRFNPFLLSGMPDQIMLTACNPSTSGLRRLVDAVEATML